MHRLVDVRRDGFYHETMNHVLTAITLTLFLPGCSENSENNALTSTLAAPKHYQVEFENDYVRVIRVRYGPGEASRMHSHEPFVGVALTGGQSIFTGLDGNSETRPESYPGDIIDGDLNPHSVMSISKLDQESVFVEIKGRYHAKDQSVPNAVVADPVNARIELERPDVRIVRIKSPAGHETPIHSHKAGVSVALTAMHVSVISASGDVTEMSRPAGDAVWSEERGAHRGKNLSDEPLEVIFFELL